GYQAYSTAATRSDQGIATTEPALTTTIVRGLTAATLSISSSWRPGRLKPTRSAPSRSQSALRPMTSSAASLSAASATARSSRFGGSGGAQPTVTPDSAPRSNDWNSNSSSCGSP